jgi:hypothetical protein
MTKNGSPSTEASGSTHRTDGTGTVVRLPTADMTRAWPGMS